MILSKDHFKRQLEDVKPVTEDDLVGRFKGDKYFTGEHIKVGDIVLYVCLLTEAMMTIQVINERDFYLFKYIHSYGTIPVVKLKLYDTIDKIINI